MERFEASIEEFSEKKEKLANEIKHGKYENDYATLTRLKRQNPKNDTKPQNSVPENEYVPFLRSKGEEDKKKPNAVPKNETSSPKNNKKVQPSSPKKFASHTKAQPSEPKKIASHSHSLHLGET